MGGIPQRFTKILPLLAVCGVGLVASLPWMLQYSYSRGYDFFLWIYNAWFLRKASAVIPNWSTFSAAGQPFFKIGGLSDGLILAALSSLFGTFGGAKVFVVLFHVLAAAGCYTLARHLARDQSSAIVCAAAYVLSWFLTITVYFQGYLSNFMIYAAFPWFVYLVDRSLQTSRMSAALAGGVLLGIAICANAQVAIKILAFAVVWAALRSWSWQGQVSALARTILAVTIVGLWLASFNVVSALSVRTEVLGVAERTNTPHAPWELFLIPAYCLNYLWHAVFDSQLFEIPLRSLRFSGYPGLSVLLLAGLSWPWKKTNNMLFVKELWIITGIAYLLYWVVFGLVPASSWVGISHNLLIFPTLSLALLSGFGVAQIANLTACRLGRSASRWSVAAGLALILLDLGGSSLLLNRYGVTKFAPERLPETMAWEAIAAAPEYQPLDRLFSYNPDHTIYLYPVLSGGRTANVIELRQRSREYQSYLKLIKAQIRNTVSAVPPSQLLSLLNARYVDVPSKAYTYTGPTGEDAPYEEYERGLGLFEADANLGRIYQRREEASDTGWARQATSPQAIYRRDHDADNIAQTIYVNNAAQAAFIPETVVAIIGNSMEGESAFEQVAVSPYFHPTKVGYLLVDDPETIAGPVRDAIGRVVQVGSWTLSTVSALYDEPNRAQPADVHLRGEESMEIDLQPAVRDRFVFLSQQYFRSWQAYDGNGEPLPKFKSGAGLTALFLPAGTARVVFRYELAETERWGRLSSLVAVLCLVAVLIAGLVKRLRLISKESG